MKAHQFLAIMIVGLTALPAIADEVTVDNVHLCCGRCLKDAKDALTGVEGVSKIRVNKTEERIAFDATGKDAAHAALKSLAKSGFYGKPSIDGPNFKSRQGCQARFRFYHRNAPLLWRMYQRCQRCTR